MVASRRTSLKASKNGASAASLLIKPAAAAANSPAVEHKIREAQIIDAVVSLYEDELRPFGRILRKRIAEQLYLSNAAESATESADGTSEEEDVQLPSVDMKELRSACEHCTCLIVEGEESGGEWSVQLVGGSPTFVDVYDPEDCYPPELWEAATVYFCGLAGKSTQFLPGGRYACAKALQARNLPFLDGFSLGRVCHIVQLAISQKKVLGYLNGAVVPYVASQSMLKAHKAEQQQPYSKQGGEVQELPFATFDVARSCLRAILDSEVAAAAGNHASCQVPLSNIKRLFRSRFQLDLSETMLGHSKLSELLQDEPFTSICEVKLASNGYVVVPKASAAHKLRRRNTAEGEMAALAPAPMIAAPPGLDLSPRASIRSSRMPPMSTSAMHWDLKLGASPPPPCRRQRLFEEDALAPGIIALEPAVSGSGTTVFPGTMPPISAAPFDGAASFAHRGGWSIPPFASAHKGPPGVWGADDRSSGSLGLLDDDDEDSAILAELTGLPRLLGGRGLSPLFPDGKAQLGQRTWRDAAPMEPIRLPQLGGLHGATASSWHMQQLRELQRPMPR
jgi:hypothetical protein